MAPSIDLLLGEDPPCAAAALAPSSHAAGATTPRRVLRDDDAHLRMGARSGERDARVLAASRARGGAIAAVRSHAALAHAVNALIVAVSRARGRSRVRRRRGERERLVQR